MMSSAEEEKPQESSGASCSTGSCKNAENSSSRKTDKEMNLSRDRRKHLSRQLYRIHIKIALRLYEDAFGEKEWKKWVVTATKRLISRADFMAGKMA